ncbi:MAG: flagellar hook-length control protein FliK [Lachnospiraceae bacterium]|nr:flagellar hook-length control protein FliK [Lachnospiraceae bacterium]
MTTPNIAVNDAWGTIVAGAGSQGNEMLPETGTDFMSVMDRTVKNQMPKVEEGVSAPVKTDNRTNTADTKTENKTPEKKTENTDSSTGRESRDAKVESREAKKTTEDTSESEVKDEVKETVVSKAEEVKANIVLKLEIDVEDLENAMEVLNISALDLLNPQIVPELVAEVTGEDISAVLTDEDIYTKVADITGMIREEVSELMQTFDQTAEEFAGTLETIRKEPQITVPEEQTENVNIKEQVPVEKNEEGFEKVKIEVESSLKDVVRTPAEANPKEKAETDVTERKSVSDEPENRGQSETVAQNVTEGKETRRDTKGEHHDTDPKNENTNTFVQNLTQTVKDAVIGNETVSNVAEPYVRAEQILDQIESSIRLGFHEDTTSMELQLHPASLGKINVKIVSANGEVTAQFEAQNASVKAALEGHVAQLKTTLEQQGVKIESVEVTVASHEFEQNLMQGGQQNAQDTNEGKRSGLRRINLNAEDDEEIEGPAKDAERIARSMMAANGTSVDFQA